MFVHTYMTSHTYMYYRCVPPSVDTRLVRNAIFYLCVVSLMH